MQSSGGGGGSVERVKGVHGAAGNELLLTGEEREEWKEVERERGKVSD